jgi:hypothetical protein
MGQERAIEAISRIEAALARIEAAAASGGNAAGPGQPAEPDERLRRAHVALRSRVEGAIAQIDRLIDSEEQA